MAPMKKGPKRKAVRRRRRLQWKLRMDLHHEEQQEVMEISSEEEEKKTETSLSSNEIREVCEMWETNKNKTKEIPRSESASELYRPSDRRL
jgi:hypothetical protein